MADNYPFNLSPPGPFLGVAQPLMPQPAPLLDVFQQQTAFNNAVTGHLNSWERREAAERKALDDQNINAIRTQLSHFQTAPLRTSVEISTWLPLEKLPETARNLVRAVAAGLGVTPELVLPCLLAAALIAARGKFKIRVGEHHMEALTAYFLIAAPSGQRKSAVAGFFRAVFADEEANLIARFSCEGHRTAQDALRRACKQMEVELANSLRDLVREHGDVATAQILLNEKIASIEGIKKNLRNQAARPRLLLDSPTPEALAIEMERQGEALGILEAEGAFLKRLRPATDDIFLKGYTAEPYSVDTKTAGSVYLRAPVLTICVLAQPEILEAIFRNEELVGHGVGARILPVFAPSRELFADGPRGEISTQLVEWYESHMRTLLRIPSPSEGRGFFVIEPTREARATLDRYSRDIDGQIRAGRFERYPAFGSKMVGHAVRLSGAVHLLKYPAPQDNAIDASTVECGIALAEFFRCHAEVAFSPEAREGIAYAPRILKWMARHRIAHFTERDALRGIGSGRHTVAQVRAGIDELETRNYLRRYVGTTKSICVVHPRAYGWV